MFAIGTESGVAIGESDTSKPINFYGHTMRGFSCNSWPIVNAFGTEIQR